MYFLKPFSSIPGEYFLRIPPLQVSSSNTSNPTSHILFRTVMMKGTGEKYEDIAGWHGRPPKDDEALEMLHNLGYSYASLEEARAEYGEPVYDGVKPPVMAAPWSRVIHAETNEITQWQHGEH